MMNALQLIADLGGFQIVKSEEHEHYWEVHAGGDLYLVDRFDPDTLMHAFIELRIRKELRERAVGDKVQQERNVENEVVSVLSRYVSDYKRKSELSKDPSFKDISAVLEALEKNVRDNLRHLR